MKKSILKVGETLNTQEQKQIKGGNFPISDCQTKAQCEGPYNLYCSDGECVPMDGTSCFVCDHRYSL